MVHSFSFLSPFKFSLALICAQISFLCLFLSIIYISRIYFFHHRFPFLSNYYYYYYFSPIIYLGHQRNYQNFFVNQNIFIVLSFDPLLSHYGSLHIFILSLSLSFFLFHSLFILQLYQLFFTKTFILVIQKGFSLLDYY